jgi:aarF domain-containing kinase
LSSKTKGQHKSENEPSMNASQRSMIKWFIIGSILGLGAVTFSDQAQHALQAAKRSGRVVGTLAVCINE